MESPSREWVQAVQTESVNENRKRLMKSSIFGDDSPQQQVERYRPPPQNAQQYVAAQPQYQVQIPNSQGNYSNAVIPSLSPFPEIQTNINLAPKIDLEIKPRENMPSREPRKLNFHAGNQMQQMRSDVTRDFEQFSQRIRGLSDSTEIKMDPTFQIPRPQPKPKPKKRPVLLPPEDESISMPPQNFTSNLEPSFSTQTQFLMPGDSF